MEEQIQVALEELKEFLTWFIKSAEGVASAAADGKITLSDADELLPILTSARKGLGGIDSVKGQFKALFVDNKEEVCQHIKEEFDIPNDDIEILIERSIDTGLSVVAIGLDWADFFKK